MVKTVGGGGGLVPAFPFFRRHQEPAAFLAQMPPIMDLDMVWMCLRKRHTSHR